MFHDLLVDKVDKAENTKILEEHFDAADSNKDGALSEDEFGAFAAAIEGLATTLSTVDGDVMRPVMLWLSSEPVTVASVPFGILASCRFAA